MTSSRMSSFTPVDCHLHLPSVSLTYPQPVAYGADVSAYQIVSKTIDMPLAAPHALLQTRNPYINPRPQNSTSNVAMWSTPTADATAAFFNAPPSQPSNPGQSVYTPQRSHPQLVLPERNEGHRSREQPGAVLAHAYRGQRMHGTHEISMQQWTMAGGDTGNAAHSSLSLNIQTPNAMAPAYHVSRPSEMMQGPPSSRLEHAASSMVVDQRAQLPLNSRYEAPGQDLQLGVGGALRCIVA